MKTTIELNEEDIKQAIKEHLATTRGLNAKQVTIEYVQTYDVMDRPAGHEARIKVEI